MRAHVLLRCVRSALLGRHEAAFAHVGPLGRAFARVERSERLAVALQLLAPRHAAGGATGAEAGEGVGLAAEARVGLAAEARAALRGVLRGARREALEGVRAAAPEAGGGEAAAAVLRVAETEAALLHAGLVKEEELLADWRAQAGWEA